MSAISSIAYASETDLEQLASLFRAISDRTRLQILLTLTSGAKNVTTICDELRQPQPTISHHLALLRTSNIVSRRRDGRQVFYGLDSHVQFEEDGQLVLRVQNLSVRIRPADPIMPIHE